MIATLRLSPASLVLRVGDQEKLTLTAFDAQGNQISGLGSITWTTSDARIATLNGNGNVRAAAVGRATITASVGGRSVTAAVEVQAKR